MSLYNNAPNEAASSQPMDIDPELREDSPASETKTSMTVRSSSPSEQVAIRPARAFVNIQPKPAANDDNVDPVQEDERLRLPPVYVDTNEAQWPRRLAAVEPPYHSFPPRLTTDPRNYCTCGKVKERSRIAPEYNNVRYGLESVGYAWSISGDPFQRKDLLDYATLLPVPLQSRAEYYKSRGMEEPRDDGDQYRQPPAPVRQDQSYYQASPAAMYSDFSRSQGVRSYLGGSDGQVNHDRGYDQPTYPNHDRSHQVPNYRREGSGQANYGQSLLQATAAAAYNYQNRHDRRQEGSNYGEDSNGQVPHYRGYDHTYPAAGYPDNNNRSPEAPSYGGGSSGQENQDQGYHQAAPAAAYPNFYHRQEVPNHGEGSSGQNSVARGQGSSSAAYLPTQGVQPRQPNADLQRWDQ
ncbi:hypothetical protein CKAH01_12801 [Colletotrichum kahawae]|uniref:Uncharacterized protein n=1 Tax=Colletotrichum kahawae TaxID=34407 RepID=A0AAD9YSB1_COLKA|nr:hypothetical protein CKAH01_12801 [Colletotrichum kahawae]